MPIQKLSHGCARFQVTYLLPAGSAYLNVRCFFAVEKSKPTIGCCLNNTIFSYSLCKSRWPIWNGTRPSGQQRAILHMRVTSLNHQRVIRSSSHRLPITFHLVILQRFFFFFRLSRIPPTISFFPHFFTFFETEKSLPTYGRTEGRTKGRIDAPTDSRIDWRKDRRAERRTGIRRRKYGHTDENTDGETERRTNGCMHE